LSSKSNGVDPLTLAKNQAQCRAELSLAQNKVVAFGKSGILSDNSSNEEQKKFLSREKIRRESL
jgi:hypothetical protein